MRGENPRSQANLIHGNHGKYRKKELTEDQKFFIRQNYKKMEDKEMALRLDLTLHYIKEFRKEEKLVKLIRGENPRKTKGVKEGFFNVWEYEGNWVA